MSEQKIVYVDSNGNAPGGYQFPQALHGARITVDDATPSSPLAPMKNARVDEWRAYAVSMGLDETEAAEATRDDLVARFGD
jgi:hypothetical protein